MNPDIYSAEFQIAQHNRQIASDVRDRRQADLHAKAVARRRKAKLGGKR